MELRADPDVALAAVRRDRRALASLSRALRGDRSVALAAVKLTGSALQFAAGKLQRDWEVVLVAVRQGSGALSVALMAEGHFPARATGPVFFHGSFCLVKVNGRLRRAWGGAIKFLDPLYETQ